MIYNRYTSLVYSSIFILSWNNCHVSSYLLRKGKQGAANPKFKDYFVEEFMKITCNTKHPNVQYWKFYGYDKTTQDYRSTDSSNSRVDVVNNGNTSELYIDSLVEADSGRYDCISQKEEAECSWKVSVHDPLQMHFILTARGQKPWDDTVVSEYSIKLQWTAWTACDGCAGGGERRRFGFCYVFWSKGKVQCKSPEVPFLLRIVANHRREEIIVDVCYDHCIDHRNPNIMRNQRVDVLNGAKLKLTCRTHGNASALDIVRWERNRETLLRNEVSFGFAETRPIFVTQNSILLLNDIEVPKGGIIKLACVDKRKMKLEFDVYVEDTNKLNVTMYDHLYWISISSSFQVTVFLLLLVLYIIGKAIISDLGETASHFDIPLLNDYSDSSSDSDENLFGNGQERESSKTLFTHTNARSSNRSTGSTIKKQTLNEESNNRKSKTLSKRSSNRSSNRSAGSTMQKQMLNEESNNRKSKTLSKRSSSRPSNRSAGSTRQKQMLNEESNNRISKTLSKRSSSRPSNRTFQKTLNEENNDRKKKKKSSKRSSSWRK